MDTDTKKAVRNQTIPLRVSVAEKVAYERAAESVGNTVSGWIRHTCSKAAGKTSSSIGGTSSPKVGRGRGWSIDPDTGEVGPSPKPAKSD